MHDRTREMLLSKQTARHVLEQWNKLDHNVILMATFQVSLLHTIKFVNNTIIVTEESTGLHPRTHEVFEDHDDFRKNYFGE